MSSLYHLAEAILGPVFLNNHPCLLYADLTVYSIDKCSKKLIISNTSNES